MLLLALSVLHGGCDRSSPTEKNRDPSCDDGSEPTCEMVPPECEEWEILAHVNDCYLCVNPDTCAPWGEAGCARDADCSAEEYCAFFL